MTVQGLTVAAGVLFLANDYPAAFESQVDIDVVNAPGDPLFGGYEAIDLGWTGPDGGTYRLDGAPIVLRPGDRLRLPPLAIRVKRRDGVRELLGRSDIHCIYRWKIACSTDIGRFGWEVARPVALAETDSEDTERSHEESSMSTGSFA